MKEITFLERNESRIQLGRGKHGVPRVYAESYEDLLYGLGWSHAENRISQMFLQRALALGQLAEHLGDREDLVKLDTWMRMVNMRDDALKEKNHLSAEAVAQLQAYCDGVNAYLDQHKPLLPLRLLGIKKIPPWQLADAILLIKVTGYINLSQTQGSIEKFITYLVQYGFDDKRIKELFPAIREKIPHELLKKVHLNDPFLPPLPEILQQANFSASNSWVVSGKHSKSGYPILANDPHLDISHLPSIWQEVVLETPQIFLAGATVPGIPGIIIGRNDHLAWGATYAFMDTIDYFIEEIRGGYFRSPQGWRPLKRRREFIYIKNKESKPLDIFETDQGFVEGDARQDGLYLSYAWSGRHNTGSRELEALLELNFSQEAAQGQKALRRLEFGSFCWSLADSRGNIAMQMSGRLPRRQRRSGLVAQPAWKKKYHWKGYEPIERLPSQWNPPGGIIITANNNLNAWGKVPASTVAMGSHRAERIGELLRQQRPASIDQMAHMHMDSYSKQAERLMPLLRPYLPHNENGKLLREWDYVYREDSLGAALFEAVYREWLLVVFGHEKNFGYRIMRFLLERTGLMAAFFDNFDQILSKKDSSWFQGRSPKEMIQTALRRGLAEPAKPYGEGRKLWLGHIFYDSLLPRRLKERAGTGPFILHGSRATVHQGQFVQHMSQRAVFAPSYRMVADLAELGLHSSMPGGSSERPLSPWYKNEFARWLAGGLKELKPGQD